MWKFVVLGLLISALSENLVAELPANAWLFSSTYRETLPDSNRNFNNETGVQYHFGRTLGQYYALDFGFQDLQFSHKNDSNTTAQTLYNISLRRYFGLSSRQWFVVAEVGQIVSKLQGSKVNSDNYGLGVGIQQTAWKDGPSLSADLRYRVDLNSESDTAYTQYNDWLLSLTMTIPFFHKSDVLRAEAEMNEAEQMQASENVWQGSGSVLNTSKFGSAALAAQRKAAKQTTNTTATTANKDTSTVTSNNKPALKSASSKTSSDQQEGALKDSIAKLRAEITALEEDEESETADFSVNSGSMISDPDQRNKNKIVRKISQRVFADRSTDTDQDGIVDFKDDCPETPLGATVDLIGCAIDTDLDGVIDLMDLCEETPADVEVDERGCGFDDDQDGVANYLDRCKDTSEDLLVDSAGCERDSDQDGVVDSKDLCAGTAPGLVVAPMGCHLTDVVVLKVKNFQAGSTILNNSAREILDQMHDIAQGRSDIRVELTGNANDPRISEFSRRISVGRANSAMLYLLEMGTDAEVKDYGAFSTESLRRNLRKLPKTEKPDDDQVNMRFIETHSR